MKAFLIAGSLQELELQNRTKTNKIGVIVVILNCKNPNRNSNLMNYLIKI
jgi:hypothetical protein